MTSQQANDITIKLKIHQNGRLNRLCITEGIQDKKRETHKENVVTSDAN
jgi:hypothetical protein